MPRFGHRCRVCLMMVYSVVALQARPSFQSAIEVFDHPKVALGTQTIVKIPLYLLVAWKDACRHYKGILKVPDFNLFDPAHDQTKVARVGQGRILGVTGRKGVRFQFLDADYIGDILHK